MTLDDIRRVDAAGMYDAVRTFPAQWREGREIALRADLQRIRREGYRQVVVVGTMIDQWLSAHCCLFDQFL